MLGTTLASDGRSSLITVPIEVLARAKGEPQCSIPTRVKDVLITTRKRMRIRHVEVALASWDSGSEKEKRSQARTVIFGLATYPTHCLERHPASKRVRDDAHGLPSWPRPQERRERLGRAERLRHPHTVGGERNCRSWVITRPVELPNDPKSTLTIHRHDLPERILELLVRSFGLGSAVVVTMNQNHYPSCSKVPRAMRDHLVGHGPSP
jgi:hypothetical protein